MKIREKERYGPVKTQILRTTPLPALGIAYCLASQDEQQRLVGMARNSGSDVAVFQTSRKSTSKS